MLLRACSVSTNPQVVSPEIFARCTVRWVQSWQRISLFISCTLNFIALYMTNLTSHEQVATCYVFSSLLNVLCID